MKTLAAALIVATMLTAPAVAQGRVDSGSAIIMPGGAVAGDEWISNGHRWKRLGDRDVDLGELPHPEHPNITTCDSHNPSVCSSGRVIPVPAASTVQVGTCQSLSPEAIKQIKDALR